MYQCAHLLALWFQSGAEGETHGARCQRIQAWYWARLLVPAVGNVQPLGAPIPVKWARAQGTLRSLLLDERPDDGAV